MSDSPDVLAEIERAMGHHQRSKWPVMPLVYVCETCRSAPGSVWPCATLRALTGWKKAEERAQQWETATGVALNREHAEQQRRFKAVEEKRALLIATENAESGLSGIVESGDFQMPDHTAFNLQGVLDDIREALLAAKEGSK